MELPLNLMPLMNRAKMSTTNEEWVDRVAGLVEEFYRTLTIALFTRYLSVRKRRLISKDDEIKRFVRRKMTKPAFGSWIRLAALCKSALIETNDSFVLTFIEVMNQKLGKEEGEIAKEICREIGRLNPTRGSYVVGKTTISNVLEQISVLRNENVHSVLTEGTLQPLVDAGFTTLVPSLIERVFQKLMLRTIVPCKPISTNRVGAYVFEGLTWIYNVYELADSEQPEFNTCYLQYFDDETPFEFRTYLVEFDGVSKRCYTYLDAKRIRFHHIELDGTSRKKSGRLGSIDEVFGLSEKDYPQKHILEEVIIDLDDAIQRIRTNIDTELADAIMQTTGDSIAKSLVANAVIKEHTCKSNNSWAWKSWYSGLVVGYLSEGDTS